MTRVDRAALPFVVVCLVAAAAPAAYGAYGLAALALVPLSFTLWFFRDPPRVVPQGDRLLISPADGRVIRADRERVSIFMNVFDVHVCRAPCAGRVAAIEHRTGRFRAAFRDAASEHNERTAIDLEGPPSRRVRFTLVAGLVARRIVCRTEVGRSVAAGERIGLIRFGSRVDVDLPPGTELRVLRGQRVRAGETPLAELRG